MQKSASASSAWTIPTGAWARYSLACALHELGRPEEAEDEYRAVLSALAGGDSFPVTSRNRTPRQGWHVYLSNGPSDTGVNGMRWTSGNSHPSNSVLHQDCVTATTAAEEAPWDV
ncbi:MAG: hypothetical protein QOJ93_1909 [Actinomycetota bacterium]|nr:hypothetical protein [Actinomycetota bacterium]